MSYKDYNKFSFKNKLSILLDRLDAAKTAIEEMSGGGGGGGLFNYDLDESGAAITPRHFKVGDDITALGSRIFSELFYTRGSIAVPTIIDLNNVTRLGEYALYNMCKTSTYRPDATVEFRAKNLEEVGDRGMGYAFNGCTTLEKVDMSKTRLIGTSGAYQAFYKCSNLVDVNLSSLERVESQGLYEAFYKCTLLESVRFDSLEHVSREGLSSCFSSCTNLKHVYFPSLTSLGNWPFSSMLSGVTGCTLHFKADAESIVKSSSGYPNFSGTNTTVLFDL